MYEYKNKILTIPNVLSLFRICLIPVFIWIYCIQQKYMITAYILVLSGITDIVDGFIARKFHMISDIGKILDPIADKLTQAAMLFCLITRFHLMILPLALMLIKEFYMGVTGFMVIQKTGKVYGAVWHGKLATFLLYVMMILHVIWHDIPAMISNILIIICVLIMILSLILYGLRNRNAINEA